MSKGSGNLKASWLHEPLRLLMPGGPARSAELVAANDLLRRRTALLTSRRRRRGRGGSSNLYTEVIESGGQRYFLKAVKPGQDRELRFYSALLGGTVRSRGPRYLIPKPLLVTQTEHSTTYLVPYYAVRTLRRPAFLRRPGWPLLQGVAAFNAAHLATAELRNCFELARCAPDVNQEELSQAFSAYPPAQVDRLHGDILDCCSQVQGQLERLSLDADSAQGELPFALAMNDFNRENAGFASSERRQQVVLMDMGRALLAPLGHDLRWHFHYTCQMRLEISRVQRVVAVYAAALREQHLEVDPRALAVAGLAGYLQNWFSQRCLLPNARAPLEQKWRRLQHKVAFVRGCLQQLER